MKNSISFLHFLLFLAKTIATPSNVLSHAQAFTDHIRTLSDSGIYTTLTMRGVESYEVTEGVNFENFNMEVELRSPHFKSGKGSEIFDVVVMVDVDGRRSFAIDRFPAMKEEAVEEFWVRKVEGRKERRAELYGKFRELGRAEEEQHELAMINLSEAEAGNFAKMDNTEILYVIDKISQSGGDEKLLKSAKAVLTERYIEGGLRQHDSLGLNRVANDVSEDPVRRRVARKILLNEMR